MIITKSFILSLPLVWQSETVLRNSAFTDGDVLEANSQTGEGRGGGQKKILFVDLFQQYKTTT